MSTFKTQEWNGANKAYGTAYDTSPDDLIVNFYMKSVRDVFATRQQGVPIHNDVVFVKIFRAGEQLNVIDRPVEESDKQRFKRQWNNFEDKKVQTPEGTPIDLLFPNNPGVADSLRGRGVYTIQQCANLTSHAIDTIGMGGQEYVNRAKQFLEVAGNGANVIKLQEDMAEKDKKISYLTRQAEDMQKQMTGLMHKLNQLTAQTTNMSTGHPAPAINTDSIDIQTAMIDNTHLTKSLAPKVFKK